MTERNETLSAKDHTIEVSTVTDVPGEFSLPTGSDRLVIGAVQKTETEEAQGGLELVSLAQYKDEQGVINYNGITIKNSGDQNDIEALLIDPLVPFDAEKGTGYKALRKGEVVSSDKLALRFGKDVGFSIGLDTEGTLLVETVDSAKPVDVLEIKPIDTVSAPLDADAQAAESARSILGIETETSEELHEEAAEDLGELAVEGIVEVEESVGEPEVEEVVETQTEGDLTEKLAEITFEYERRVDNVLDDVLSRAKSTMGGVSSEVEESAGGVRMSLARIGESAESLVRIALRIESGDNDPSYVRRALDQVNGELHGDSSRLRRAIEGAESARSHARNGSDLFGSAVNELRQTDAIFEKRTTELVEAGSEVAVPELSAESTIRALDETKSNVGELDGVFRKSVDAGSEYLSQVRGAINMIDDMVQEATRGRIDTDTVRRVARLLSNLSGDQTARQSLNQASSQIDDIQRSLSQLSE